MSQYTFGAAQERVKFPVGVGTKTLGTGLIWLATKKGFFDEFALDVQPVLLRGTTVGVQSLASGATTVLKRIFKKNGLDYPADYKLLAVGGGNFNLAALSSGQVAAAFLVVPLVHSAEEQGMNVLGYYKDYFPNCQLTVMSVKRGW